MSIRTNRRRGIRVGLRNGAWGSSGNWSSQSLEWSAFCSAESTVGREAWKASPQRTLQLEGIRAPRLATLGFISNQKTSELPWPPPAWKKWPEGKCHCYASCWELLEITLSSKPHWNRGSSSLDKLCVLLISILTLRTGSGRRHSRDSRSFLIQLANICK